MHNILARADVLSVLILLVRVLTVIPLIIFVRHQIKIKEHNGIVRKMRRLTTAFVGSISLLLLTLVTSRIEILLGLDIINTPNNLMFLFISIIVFFAVWYAVYEYKKISHHLIEIEKNEHH